MRTVSGNVEGDSVSFPNSMEFSARIVVSLRPSVLDPAGTAVQHSLHHLGYESVEGVRIGKNITLTLTAADTDTARQDVEAMCEKLLTNPVIENYTIEIESVAAAVS